MIFLSAGTNRPGSPGNDQPRSIRGRCPSPVTLTRASFPLLFPMLLSLPEALRPEGQGTGPPPEGLDHDAAFRL